MKVLVIGHAYTAPYNRIDKLSRIAADSRIERLGVVIPAPWRDRMMDVSRPFNRVAVDDLYDLFTIKPLFTGSQSKYVFFPNAIIDVLQRFNPDLIHIEQEPHDLISAEFLWLNAQIGKKPVVLFTWENIDRSLGTLNRRARLVSLKGINHLIAGNNESIEVNRNHGYSGPVSVIPQFGVDVNRFKPIDVANLRQSHNLDNRFVLGFVGRYTQAKGIETLLTAFESLPSDLECTLLLLSSMQPPEWLQERIKQLGERVKCFDNIPHEDFPRYMNLFDVLVLPSETQPEWKEQFGRVMIESMACGVPVIGSSSGAIPEVIGEHGWLFPERDVKALTQTIEQILSDREAYETIKSRVRDYVVERYSHEAVVEHTINVWEKCVS